MPIPNASLARIPPEKLTDYLLNDSHPVGSAKAKWFHQFGYELADPAALERDLLELVRESDDFSETSSPFGTKYVVSGRIKTPNGAVASVVSVWIVESSNGHPRLVTAFPGEKR